MNYGLTAQHTIAFAVSRTGREVLYRVGAESQRDDGVIRDYEQFHNGRQSARRASTPDTT